MSVDARARDLRTGDDRTDHSVVAKAQALAMVAPDGCLVSLSTDPAIEAVASLAGLRSIGAFRRRVEEIASPAGLPGSPLLLLLDDVMAAAAVAPSAWSHWIDDWISLAWAERREAFPRPRGAAGGACIAHAAFPPDRPPMPPAAELAESPVPELPHPLDPEGWHCLPPSSRVSHRRARLIDVWRTGATTHVRSHFQDSALRPDGVRVALHDYVVRVRADADGLTFHVVPRRLPYQVCRSAIPRVAVLKRSTLDTLRENVRAALAGPLGCTHLNDVLRSIGQAAILTAHLASDGSGPA